jgi:hypothetical protein
MYACSETCAQGQFRAMLGRLLLTYLVSEIAVM